MPVPDVVFCRGRVFQAAGHTPERDRMAEPSAICPKPVAQQVGEVFDSLEVERHESRCPAIGMMADAVPCGRKMSIGMDNESPRWETKMRTFQSRSAERSPGVHDAFHPKRGQRTICSRADDGRRSEEGLFVQSQVHGVRMKDLTKRRADGESLFFRKGRRDVVGSAVLRGGRQGEPRNVVGKDSEVKNAGMGEHGAGER